MLGSFVGSVVVALLGLLLLAGMSFYLGGMIVHQVPALRFVRFDSKKIRRATPWRLRFLGFPRGRRVRARSRAKREGRYRNLVVLVGSGLGFLLCLVGTPLLLTLVLSGELTGEGRPWVEIGLFIASAFAGGAAALRFQRSFRAQLATRRRIRSPTAAEVRARDSRPPVVMLRAFDDDGRPIPVFEEKAMPVTLENVLASRLARRGPLVAVGRPGEPLPPAGAGREYVSGDWKPSVRRLIEEAGVIAVLLHKTPGLLWEIEQIFALGREDRSIILIPDVEATELEERWKAVRVIIEACRPDLDHDRLSVSLNETLAVVFDRVCRPHRILGRARYRHYYRDAVEQALWFVESDGGDRSPTAFPPRRSGSSDFPPA